MVTYMPILKGRQAEFNAIANLPTPLAPHVMPILEVVPTAEGPIRDAYQFANKVRRWLPAGMTIAVDVRRLADTARGTRRPLCDITNDLCDWLLPMLPVLHLDDSPEQLADVRYAARVNGGGTVLRLGDETRDPDDAEAERALDRLHDRAGLTIERCHLVLDAFEVRSERDLTRVEPVIRKCLAWAQRHPWESVTVAACAIPESLSHIPVNTPTPVPRWDLHLRQRVADVGVQYADYGIAYPGMAGPPWRPNPSLRYSDEDVWWIYRWPRASTDTNPMYDLCATLVASDHWPAQGRHFSWGDRQIADCASGVRGPGSPTDWRAWATSHHLAQVVGQLAARDPTRVGDQSLSVHRQSPLQDR